MPLTYSVQTTPFTRAQRVALKRLYDRQPLYAKGAHPLIVVPVSDPEAGPRMTYRQFRRLAYVSHAQGCVMVPWCGMQVGIEDDGHVHT